MQYIDTPASLEKVCAILEGSSWAALDTEADSLHHYTEKLCLLQISASGEDFVIDPLVGLDLKPLLEVLARKRLILHGADFDVRIIKRTWNFHPKEIFDTMLAAQLLGYPKQGLADLALKHCGVTLCKASQKTDWSKRPLDEKHIIYGANDTHYLGSIREIMERELLEKGRLSWQAESCERLLKSLEDSAEREEGGRERPWQIKGSRNLKGRALTFLRELWVWREEEARKRDRPVFKTLNSEYLIGISQWCQDNPGMDVQEWPGAPRNVRGEHRDTINEIVRQARLLPETRFIPEKKIHPKKRWGNAESQRLAALKAEKDRIGLELKIQASLLATNAVLEILAEAAPRNRRELENLGCLMHWQIETVGESFLTAIRDLK